LNFTIFSIFVPKKSFFSAEEHFFPHFIRSCEEISFQLAGETRIDKEKILLLLKLFCHSWKMHGKKF
jgi:hypothetical protein